MSKYVKDLVTRDIKRRLEGVEDAVLVSCVGMDANTTNELRGELDKRDRAEATTSANTENGKTRRKTWRRRLGRTMSWT